MKTMGTKLHLSISVWLIIQLIGLLIATSIWGWSPRNACLNGIVGISNICATDIANNVLIFSTVAAALGASVVVLSKSSFRK